jgi:hypothetical protein
MIAKFSEHEPDGGKAQEGEPLDIEILPVFGEPAASVEPCQGAFDNPAFGKNDKALCRIGSFDDLDFKLRHDPGQTFVKDRPSIGAVSEEFLQEWEHAENGGEQQDATVAVLNACRMHNRVQQQALRVYENMPLLALNLLSRIEPRRIDAGPPFSALLTLWLSIMQAVGLASRPACSRHFS